MENSEITQGEIRDGRNFLRRLLNRRMRCVVKDERIFIGTFVCYDKQGNIVMSDSEEYRRFQSASEAKQDEERRIVGWVLIPSHALVSCHVETYPDLEGLILESMPSMPAANSTLAE
mmetsp:Transcript_12769/g.22008  ORF Transcript_12769/g.22008 Transcript_12769/m.22008 type:complete len:117 (+) Transcript_12769:23-373(+)